MNSTKFVKSMSNKNYTGKTELITILNNKWIG